MGRGAGGRGVASGVLGGAVAGLGMTLIQFLLGVEAPVSFLLLQQIFVTVLVNTLIALPVYALVRRIRAAAPKRAPVPAIALMPRGSRRRTAARGFRASVPQPFHVRELCAAILDVVKSR